MAELPVFSEITFLPDFVSVEGRKLFYRAVMQELRHKTKNGRSIPHGGANVGRAVMKALTELIFLALMRDGVFIFPEGWGSLVLRRGRGKKQRKVLPSGKIAVLPKGRVTVAYNLGNVARMTVGLPSARPKRRKFLRRSVLSKKTLDLVKEPNPSTGRPPVV